MGITSTDTFLGRSIYDQSKPWPEWALQSYVIQEARRMGLLIIGDMAAGKRNPGMAKAVGLTAGHPDLSIWLSGGRVLLVELKTPLGRLSKDQASHHAKLADLGHKVYVIQEATPAATWQAVKKLL